MKKETTKELQAIHYGEVELIPGIKCDGYILSDGTACLSERGTARLLGMDHKALKRMSPNWPPKIFRPFIDDLGMGTNSPKKTGKSFVDNTPSMGTNSSKKTDEPFIGAVQSMTPKSIKVIAKNSPYQGRNIVTYDSKFIGSFIRGYAQALAYQKLRPNQTHIGERCVILSTSLIDTTIYTAIQQACGLNPNIQQIAQVNYVQVGQTMKNTGLTSSIGNDIYTKKDITNYIDVPLGTLNSNIRKLHDDISVINLDRKTIKASGSKAPRMNGYNLEDVGKIVLGMDSIIGIELKKQVFGTVGTLAKLDTKGEIEWQSVLSQVFENLGFNHNYQIGKYKVDFFIKDLNLVLECNGYDNHSSYDKIEEAEREKFITKNYSLVRFHHLIDWKTLMNGILRTKKGDTTVLYNADNFASVFEQDFAGL